jgi:hypothetical protein
VRRESGKRLPRNSSNDFKFSSRQYCPARTSHRYLPSSTKRVSRSASFRCSHARISSILVRTNSARLRLSLDGIGGYLVNKFVKQTKIDSRLAHEGRFDQVALVEAEPEEGAGGTGILRKADAAMRQEQSRSIRRSVSSTRVVPPTCPANGRSPGSFHQPKARLDETLPARYGPRSTSGHQSFDLVFSVVLADALDRALTLKSGLVPAVTASAEFITPEAS